MPSNQERELLVWFGGNLRTIRLKAGLSQEKLALSANLDRTYIGGVERGERNISLINIVKIASVLKIGPAELLSNFPGIEKNN